MTRPINENLKQRQETILMVAEEVFAQYSFAGATIRLITQKSGINSSMVGYYFGSKEALYEHIFKLRLEEITEEISRFEMLDLEAPEKLQIYLTTYIKRVDANQSFYRLLSNELTTPQHPSIILLASKGRKLVQDFLLKTIRDGTSRGYFKRWTMRCWY